MSTDKLVRDIVAYMVEQVRSSKGCVVKFVNFFEDRRDRVVFRRVMRRLEHLGVYGIKSSRGNKYFITCETELYRLLRSGNVDYILGILMPLLGKK